MVLLKSMYMTERCIYGIMMIKERQERKQSKLFSRYARVIFQIV